MAEAASGGIRRGTRPPDLDLLKHNLGMAAALEEFLASTYGPGGRAKLVKDPKGKPIPTASGARMLETLPSDHPVVQVLRSSAQAQEEEWGDGTKLAALLALSLLRRAGGLLDRGVRPPHLVQGYEQGLRLAIRRAEEVSVEADPRDEVLLEEVTRAALGGWIEGEAREGLVRAVVQAALHAAEPTEAGWRCDREDVHLFALPASGFGVELVEGYVLQRFPDHPDMPRRVRHARIALFDAAPIRGKAGIHAPRLRWIGESKILLKSPREMEEYEDWGADYTRELVEGLVRAGANVVLCRLGISDHGHRLLADAGILGIRRIMKTRHMEAVARATGAAFLKDFKEVRPQDLGYAGLVEERRFGGERYLVITGARNPKVVSLMIHAPGEALAEQHKELAAKALGAVAAFVGDPRLVPGGASLEVAAARFVRQEAPRVGGRAQLAVEAFGGALEDLTVTLAHNLGLDPTDALLELRSVQVRSPYYGLRAGTRGPVDLERGPLRDPLALRVGAWGRAVEVARSVLRVDDFHKTGKGFADPEKERERKEREKDLPEERDSTPL